MASLELGSMTIPRKQKALLLTVRFKRASRLLPTSQFPRKPKIESVPIIRGDELTLEAPI
jgi:hypothetical protein